MEEEPPLDVAPLGTEDGGLPRPGRRSGLKVDRARLIPK